MRINFILLGFSLLFLQCANSEIRSMAQKEPIEVDGFAQDWENYPVEYNEEWHVVYGAVHSDSSLFLQFSFNDPQLARMMAGRGITLWFSKDRKFGLRYTEQLQKDDFKKFSHDEMYIPKGDFSVVAKDTILNPNILNYPALAAELQFDKGLYCLEFSLPLHPENNLSFLKNIFSDTYYFGFELAAVSKEQREKMKEERAGKRIDGGRSPGGISGGRGGRKGGRSGAGRMPSQPKDSEGKEIWFEVIMNNGK